MTAAPHPSRSRNRLWRQIGLHTLLVPMVDTADHARAMVRACRYPPHGIRGVSSATSRGANFGSDTNYLHEANDRITLIVQIESTTALANIDEIAKVEGVDALFIGPSDLAASMGYIGQPMHPAVQEAITAAKAAIDRAGKPAGIFAVSPAHARICIADGFRFLSVGTDIGLLISGSKAVLEEVRSEQ